MCNECHIRRPSTARGASSCRQLLLCHMHSAHHTFAVFGSVLTQTRVTTSPAELRDGVLIPAELRAANAHVLYRAIASAVGSGLHQSVHTPHTANAWSRSHCVSSQPCHSHRITHSPLGNAVGPLEGAGPANGYPQATAIDCCNWWDNTQLVRRMTAWATCCVERIVRPIRSPPHSACASMTRIAQLQRRADSGPTKKSYPCSIRHFDGTDVSQSHTRTRVA